MKRSLVLVFLLIFALVFTGCSFKSSSGGSEASNAKTAAATTAATTAATAAAAKIGDPVLKDGVQITVTKIDRSDGTQIDVPKTGDEYVIVSVKIENKSADNLEYSPAYFKLKNSEGEELSYKVTLDLDNDTALDLAGNLAAGGNAEGTIVFETKKGDNNLVLQYYENILDSDPIMEINLK